ncbi:MAG: hypothetical protein ACREMY_01140, partial [bacterium]
VYRYGYREAQPYVNGGEMDQYFAPSGFPQDGYQYVMGDMPGMNGNLNTFTSSGEPTEVAGVSLEIHFRGDVVEIRNLVPVQVWARLYWSYEAHFEITSASPLRFKAIPHPPG